MVRPERPHVPQASPKGRACGTNRTEPTRDQTSGTACKGSMGRQSLVSRWICHDDHSPTAADGGVHHSPMSDAKPLQGSGAAEHAWSYMLSADDHDGNDMPSGTGHGVEGRETSRVPYVALVGPPLLITVEEASQLLRLGRTRTYDFIRCGSIQSVKVGRRRLVVRSSLDSFVQSLIAGQGELSA